MASEVRAGDYVPTTTDNDLESWRAHLLAQIEALRTQIANLPAGGGTQPTGARPVITDFTVTGQQHPQPGSIAGQTYQYEWEIANSAHADTVTLWGFEGEHHASVPAGSTHMNFSPDEFAQHSGTFTVPAGVSLADGDSYTIGLVVYDGGNTPAIASRRDYVITAHAASGRVHFGVLGSDKDASDIPDDFSTDSYTRGSTAGVYEAAGIPNRGGWRLYLAVPADFDQPMGWTVGGIDQSILWSRGVATDRTIDGTAYKIYITTTAFLVDGDYNGQRLTVTT